MQIVNYTVSAIILLVLVLLFLKAALPHAKPPVLIPKRLPPSELKHRVKVLAMNSLVLTRSGGGVSAYAASREIRRFFSACDKSGAHSGDAERMILSRREDIERLLCAAEKSAPEFFALPHKGNYPRLYSLCMLLCCGDGACIDRETVEDAIAVTNECSPLSAKEILFFGDMLKLCIVQRLASLLKSIRFDRKMRERARRDSERGRINLSDLKYDAYISALCTGLNAGEKRKLDALCLENGIDTVERVAAYDKTEASRTAAAFGLIKAAEEATRMSNEPPIELYCGYALLMKKNNGFAEMSFKEKSSALAAVGAYCRRKRMSETAFIGGASPERQSEVFFRDARLGRLALIAAVAMALGMLPLVIVTALIPRYFVLSLPALPVTVCAALKGVGIVFGGAEASEKFGAHESEFSAEYVPVLADLGKKTDTRLKDRLKAVLSVLNVAAAFAAPVLAVISPLFSAYWLLAAFSREIVALACGLRRDLTEGKNPLATAAAELISAAQLPLGILDAFGARKVKWARALTALLSAALLVLLTALSGGSAACYVAAAAFAVGPLFGVAKRARPQRKQKSPRDFETSEHTYEDVGTPEKVDILSCGDYTAIVSERGNMRGYYDSRELFKAMRFFVGDERRLSELKAVPPFVTGEGRTINNALCGGRIFEIETFGAENGVEFSVSARDGGEFCLSFVCVPTGKYALSGENMFSPNADGSLPSVLFGGCEKASIESGTVFGSENVDREYIAVKANARKGRVSLGVYCEKSADSLKAAASRRLSPIARASGAVYSATLSRRRSITSAVCDMASYILFGRSTYSPPLRPHIDTRYSTLLCVRDCEGGDERLYRRLKRMSVLKDIGLKFNVVVACFEPPKGFARVHTGIARMFDTLRLGRGGRACCLNCYDDPELFDRLKESCMRDDEIRRKTLNFSPEVRGAGRVPLPLDPPETKFALDSCGVCENGDSVYIGDNVFRADALRTTAKSGFGFSLRPDGRGHTFDGETRLTGEQAPLAALPSEFVLFGENGRVWSASQEPLGNLGELYALQSADRTVFVCTSMGLKVTQTVSLKNAAGLTAVRIYNPRKTARKIEVLACALPVVADDFEQSRHVLELERTDRGAKATNTLSGKTLYLLTDGEFDCAFSLDGITGENGRINTLDVEHSIGAENALILRRTVKIKSGETVELRFALTTDKDFDFDDDLSPFAVSPLKFSSKIPELDALAVRLAARVKTGLFTSGAMGSHFAEPLVKCAALLPECSDELGKLIADRCRRRFTNGDILLYRRRSDGERASWHGAALFLPLAVAKYIDATDDRDILFMRVPYLESYRGRTRCRISDKKASVLTHCLEILFGASESGYSRCFGIDGRLLALKAIAEFLPLVRDGEARLRLAEIKTSLMEDTVGVERDEMSLTDMSWLALSDADREVSVKLLTKKAQGAEANEIPWAIAALLKKGAANEAYLLFSRLNPLSEHAAFKSGDFVEVTPALMLILLKEGFFGFKMPADTLVMRPSLPDCMKTAAVSYDDGKVSFDVDIDNTGRGKWNITVGGIAYSSDSVTVNDSLCGKRIGLRRR